MKPNPGSNEAIDAGCTCPVLDNAHGRGAQGTTDRFWMTADCPLHGGHEQTNEERAAWTCALETGNYIHPDELKEFMDKKKGTSCP